MRRYLLDILLCPHCGHYPLVLNIYSEHEIGAAHIAPTSPCTLYCAYKKAELRTLRDAPPCAQCLSYSVDRGTLVCSSCHTYYGITDGILDMSPPELIDDWVAAEKEWWDRHYAKIHLDDVHDARPHIVGLRSYERGKELFEPLKRRGVVGSKLLDVGSGLAHDVVRLLPPRIEGYYYIGIDIARAGLLSAARRLPEGDFVQCEVGRLPFRTQTFEVMLCFGILHHLPHWQETLQQMLGLLKPAAWLLFNEAIEKPSICGGVLKRWLGAAVDSPHGGAIQADIFIKLLRHQGSILILHKRTTTARVLLIWLLGRLLNRSILLSRLVLWADAIALRSIGPLTQRFGPAETLGIFEKRASSILANDPAIALTTS
jgi:uncharacterized protein YbaR (Trm112 family)